MEPIQQQDVGGIGGRKGWDVGEDIWRRRNQVCRLCALRLVLLEEDDMLGMAVLVDFKVFLAQAGDRLIAAIGDKNVDDDSSALGSNGRRRGLRGGCRVLGRNPGREQRRNDATKQGESCKAGRCKHELSATGRILQLSEERCHLYEIIQFDWRITIFATVTRNSGIPGIHRFYKNQQNRGVRILLKTLDFVLRK